MPYDRKGQTFCGPLGIRRGYPVLGAQEPLGDALDGAIEDMTLIVFLLYLLAEEVGVGR